MIRRKFLKLSVLAPLAPLAVGKVLADAVEPPMVTLDYPCRLTEKQVDDAKRCIDIIHAQTMTCSPPITITNLTAWKGT